LGALPKIIFQFILFGIFLLIIQCCSFAQNYKINYEHITTKKGLSNNFINHIIQDSKGFIWIATQDGLNKYDGSKFEVFKVNPNTNEGLASNIINYLAEDDEGNIWIGTEQGLAKWSRNNNQIQNILSFQGERIESIYQDNPNNTWIVSQEYIYQIDKKGNVSKTGLNSLKELQKEEILVEYLGKIKIHKEEKLALIIEDRSIESSRHSLLYFFNPQRQTWDLALKTWGHIEYVCPEGEILLSFEKDFQESGSNEKYSYKNYRTKELTVKTIQMNTNMLQKRKALCYIKEENNIWCLGNNKLFLINPKNTAILRVLDKSFFNDNLDEYSLNGLFKDKQDNIWLYTGGVGFFIFPQYALNNFKAYKLEKNNKKFSIRAVYQEENGILWLSAYHLKNHLNIFSESEEQKSLFLDGMTYKILPDLDKKILWIATDRQKLYKVDKAKKTVLKQYPIGAETMIQVSTGEIYLGLGGGKPIIVFNPQTEKWKVYENVRDIDCFYIDSFGNFWIGSEVKGLGLLDTKTMQVQYFYKQNNNLKSISSNFVKSIYEDSKGRFWVATTLGLNLFDRKTKEFTRFTEKDGLPNNMVYAILEDEKGNLWLSTNKGISRFNPETKVFTNYDESYGLQDNEFNTNAFFKNEKTGEMFFGGIRGLNSFYPEKMKRNEFIPPIILTSFKRKGKEIKFDKPLSEIKEIRMTYDQAQSLTFEFVALSFFQNHKNQYAYKIEEIHQDWIDLGTLHEITLTNLNAGTYTLRIKGSNNHGLWNEKGLKIKLIVNPPFWQTWWFISILVLLSLLSFYGIYRWRLYQLKAREKFLENEVNIRTEEIKTQSEVLEKQAEELSKANKTKDQLFAIIAHDLRSPISAFESITQQLDFYIEQNEIERVKDLSQYIKTSSSNLNNLLNNLLSWALMQKDFLSHQAQNLKLKEIIEETAKSHQILLENYQIELKLNIEENLEIYADENALNTILRNLLNNAIKFTPKKGSIEIKSYAEEKYTIIEIIDTGKGILQEKIAGLFTSSNIKKSKGLRGEKGTGLGLVLVGEFMEMHKGTIQVFLNFNKNTLIYTLIYLFIK